VWQKHRVRHRWPISRTCCSFVLIRRAGLLVRVARLSSFSLLANISYRLLVGPHSPRWPTVPTRRSSALILHAGLLLLCVTRLTLFLLTYIRMCGRNSVFDIGGHHLVRVSRLSSFAVLGHSYALLLFRHSPCWPTSPTRSASALILPYLLLVRVARLPSFSLLAPILTLLLVGPHFLRWPTARTHSVPALILPYLLLICVARLPLFSSLAYILYELLVCPYSPHWSTSCTCCSSALMRRRMCPIGRD